MPELVKDLLKRATKRLKQAKISESRLSAEYLLQHVLNLKKIEFQLSKNKGVPDSQIKLFDELVERRIKHVPVQYLIGNVDFYNVRLQVNEHVLIPRPETEELVDCLLKRVKTMTAPKILDIGTGSGNIAIALAANLRNAKVVALDISDKALSLAAVNARDNEVDTAIEFVCGDVFADEFWNNREPFDIIVSNPPYVEARDFETLQPEIKLYEPRKALVSESDVYAFYRAISKKAADYLNDKGVLCFEIGMGQADTIKKIIRKNMSVSQIEIVNDLSGIPRIIIAYKK